MITGSQIRAARSLVGWTAEELAERAGVNRESVFRAERADDKNGFRPLAATTEKITRVLNDEGIVFIGLSGVDRRSDSLRVLEGEDCYLRLLNEVLLTLKGRPGGEVLSICTDDSISPPAVVEAIKQWHDAGIKCRFLSHAKAQKFDFPREEYRLIPSKYFNNSVMVVYANKVATLRSDNKEVVIISDEDQAEMLRGLFNLIWSQSDAPKRKK
ncbi:MAG: helix-turn-helix transcriptional regulator [Alphaproteobacteria bacterium]